MALSKKQQKIVAELDKRVEMTREFMNDWLLFNQILTAYPSPGVNKAQLENQFLKIKSKVAREHRVLRDTLQADYAIEQNAMNIISGATNLEAIYAQSEVAVKKLQNEWHRAFISINETLGTIEDKKTRAENGEKIFIMPTGGGGGKGMAGGGGGMSDQAKKNLIIIVVIIGILVALFVIPSPIRDMYLDALKDLGIGSGSGKNPLAE
ncbi:MAG: hypothetical protein QG656_1150 [Candidatus Hydrogenedentes bacterium]|nr:hypothetical protein [Candidatus Hydrogenedentota bacterium]